MTSSKPACWIRVRMKKMRSGGGIADRELPQIHSLLVAELNSDAGFPILTSPPPIPTPFCSDLRILNSVANPASFCLRLWKVLLPQR